jgi:hypothetical protein
VVVPPGFTKLIFALGSWILFVPHVPHVVQENTEQTVKVLLTEIVLDALYVHQVPTALDALGQALEPVRHALLVN